VAGDLDALDPLAIARGARVEQRRAADLRALVDLDLLAEADQPVAREMHGERTGGAACRRVLVDPQARHEVA